MKKLIVILTILTSIYADDIKILPSLLNRVVDGDTTVMFNRDIGMYRCRLYGIDTPESFNSNKLTRESQKYGLDAREIVKAGKISAKKTIEYMPRKNEYIVEIHGTDKYNRNLCVIKTKDGENINIKLVKNGYAVVYKHGKYTKDKLLRHQLNVAQGEAVKFQNGLWNINTKPIMTHMANN